LPSGLIWDPADSGLKLGRVEEKIREEKIQREPATRLTRQDPVKNPVVTR